MYSNKVHILPWYICLQFCICTAANWQKLIMKYIAKAVTSLLFVLKILKEYLLPMKHDTSFQLSKPNGNFSFTSCTTKSSHLCYPPDHILFVSIKALLFFLPFPSLCLRKSKSIFFEQFKNANIQSGYLRVVPHEIMWNANLMQQGNFIDMCATVPSAPYTRPTQQLSRPPLIHKLGAENRML